MNQPPRYRPTPAVSTDDLRLEIREALEQSRRLGFKAVDISAVRGPVSPDELSQTGKRHFRKHLDDLGLRLSSLRGPAGGRGYHDPEESDGRLAAMRKVISLASDMRVPVVSTILGTVGPELDDLQQSRLREALEVMATDSDRLGVTVAIESAGIEQSVLRDLLASVNCPTLVACCDTGALLMQGDDPHRVGEFLGGRIGLVRARDAIAGSPGAVGHEVAMGSGQLNPAAFLAALAESGFTGDMVMTRSSGSNVAADLAHAREVFEKLG